MRTRQTLTGAGRRIVVAGTVFLALVVATPPAIAARSGGHGTAACNGCQTPSATTTTAPADAPRGP
jgi:hypothetical protein